MRAAPPFQVSLKRFDAWHAAVWALGGIGVAATLAWALSHARPVPALLIGGAMLTIAAIAWLGRPLTRTRATDVRWDGADWHLAFPPEEPMQGRLGVAIDLGPWMLLRFVPATGAGRQRSIWVPAQRRGLETAWHGLRCALYSPRPTTVAGATASQGAALGRNP